jgi:hypothetical protein
VTIDTFLTKRRARYRGEVGLFPDSEMAENDIAPIASNTEVQGTLRIEKNIKALRFLWGLVHKVADNTDYFLDKDDAMASLKLRVGFSKAVYNPFTRRVESKPKSLTRIDDVQLRLLTEKMKQVILTELLPGVPYNNLRKEIEEMMQERSVTYGRIETTSSRG